jgi:hypothetical protein
MTGFEGFGPKVRMWFKDLEADNSREYFAATRDFFEESIREQMEALLTELSASFGGDVKMFRQTGISAFPATSLRTRPTRTAFCAVPTSPPRDSTHRSPLTGWWRAAAIT